MRNGRIAPTGPRTDLRNAGDTVRFGSVIRHARLAGPPKGYRLLLEPSESRVGKV